MKGYSRGIFREPALIECQKSQYNYYWWKVSQYGINDVSSIVDCRSKKIIYELDEEIFSNFVGEYISKLKL